MGTFGGHALPGSFFILISIWHLMQIYRRYYRCKQDNSVFKSMTSFPTDCLCGQLKEWPVESVLKLLLVSVGFVMEIYTGTRNGVFDAPGNEQHATMFFFFGLTGVIEILIHFKANLPPLVEYVSFILAISVEFILFRFHLHGRKDLDVLLHTLLLYVIACTIVAVLVEMINPNKVLAALTSRYLFLVQGTWFWHIGFILYNPREKWDQESHRQMMTATTYFVWHLGTNFLLVVLLGTVISCFYRRNGGYSGDDALSMKRLIDSNSNRQTIVNMNDDSEDDDIEFQKPY